MDKKILVADDDPGIVDVLTLILELEGFEVISTQNGAAVLDITENYPDLILLDIWMSGVDGRDICRQLKQNKTTKEIPVVLVSASHNIKNSALESGADDFLEKPFDRADLLELVKKYTG